jgi:hypothetical protein
VVSEGEIARPIGGRKIRSPVVHRESSLRGELNAYCCKQCASRPFGLSYYSLTALLTASEKGLSLQYGSYQRMHARHSGCDSSMFWSRIAHQAHILKAKMTA